MRDISSQQDAVLTRQHYKVVAKLEIEDPDGALVDVTNFKGVDWLKAWEYGEDVDTPVSSATFTIHARKYLFSFNPEDEDSVINRTAAGAYSPFLELTNQVLFSTATIPIDQEPVSADFEVVFDGAIDIVDEKSGKDKNEIVLECRDRKSQELQDTWIENVERYGDGTADDTDFIVNPYPLEVLTQDILDNWPGKSGAITLFSPGGTAGTPFNVLDIPGFDVTAWDVGIQSVLDAVRLGAHQIGWECRVRWQNDPTVESFELQLYDIDRTTSTVLRTFGPGSYRNIGKFSNDISRIRNVVIVEYQTDPQDPTTRTEVSVTDTASVTKYGRRWMKIAEEASSAIDSGTEAGAMANAILSDVREPEREQSIEFSYFFAVEIGDLYRILSNNIHYSTSKDYAVVGVRHSGNDSGKALTIIQTRRAPSAGISRWWGRAQFPGLGDVTRDKPPTTPTPTLDDLDHGILIEWPQVQSKRFAYYEVYMSTSASFTPDDSNRVARTRNTRHRMNGLDQGTEYFFKIPTVDQDGNVGSNSSEVSSVPGFLRGFPGRIETTLPDEATLQPGQLVMTSVDGAQGQMLRRWDKTYTDLGLQTTTQEPTAYYKQNETAGAVAIDESSNGNDGTYAGGVSFTQGPIVPNGAANCVGYFGSARIDLDNLALLAQTAISWEAWLELTPAVGGGWSAATVFNIFDVDNAAGISQFQAFFQAGANQKAAILNVRVGNNLITFAGVTAQDFFVDGPAHMAITWASGDGLVHVYRNGVLISTSTAVHLAGTLDIDDCAFFSDQAGASVRSISGLSDHMIFWVGAEIPAAEIKERVDLAGQPDVRYERVTPVSQVRGKYLNSLQQSAVASGTIVDWDSPVVENGMTMTTVGANVGRLTINNDGLYAITLVLVLSGATAAATKLGRVLKNGSGNAVVRTNREVGGVSVSLVGSGEVYLKAGDFLDTDVILGSGTVNILLSTTATTRGYLTVRRVGEGLNVN